MNVSLEPEVEQLISRQLASGCFRSASEVVAAGLRLLAQAESWESETLEGRLLAGLESGASEPMTEADWSMIGSSSERS